MEPHPACPPDVPESGIIRREVTESESNAWWIADVKHTTAAKLICSGVDILNA
jgi:hypothetical protein